MKAPRAIALYTNRLFICKSHILWLQYRSISSFVDTAWQTVQPFEASNIQGARRFASSSRQRAEPAMETHKKAVEEISASVKNFYNRKEKFRIYHGSTNSTRGDPRKPGNAIDTSRLANVLSVDVRTKTAFVEPNVPMDRLVEATLKYDLVPPVVMEFPGITVGGGYSGTSGESSSFKHGFFDRTLNSVEMVLANGEVVTLSERQRQDLFRGAAGAVGSLGVTTMVEIQLREAKKFVKTTYHPISSMGEAIRKIEELSVDSSLDYVDGIMFSLRKGAIITGRLTDEHKSDRVQCFSAPWDPWFYLHVQKAISKSTEPVIEMISLAEYLFRYDRGGFWVGESAFDYFKVPFNRFTRWLLDDFLHTRMMYTALHASGQAKKYIVQDLALPFDTAEEFVKYTDEKFAIYPLWLCPLKQSSLPTMHPHNKSSIDDKGNAKPLLNIGLWGFGPKNSDDFVFANRNLEQKLKDLGGMKWLYAHTYYSEDEFWEMYDRKWYDDLRIKYDATSLPSVYEKVQVDPEAEKRRLQEKGFVGKLHEIWPFSGFYGIWKAIKSGTYKEARKSTWKYKAR